MVILSTLSENRPFADIEAAENYGCKKLKKNCCVLSEDGRVLSFKREGRENKFQRIKRDNPSDC